MPRHITIAEAFSSWQEEVMPGVIAQYGADDETALSESWNDYTDMLCKDGALNDLQYHHCPAWDGSMPDADEEPGWILEQMGVAMGVTSILERSGDVSDSLRHAASHFRIKITRGRRALRTEYSQGSAHNGETPELARVLYSLLMESESIESSSDFEDWADNCGYDTGSHLTKRLYNACQKISRQVREMFTAAELSDLAEIFADF